MLTSRQCYKNILSNVDIKTPFLRNIGFEKYRWADKVNATFARVNNKEYH